ncbi:hypothetical protein [Paenibacillus polymyxa]|uniref:hypothetical protein n=1 Tax=Paenibacillus polymyxa TaxID=1406 RepID=UPI002AB34B20|nr:hypothetical protein [Paenibacillus polymyxa]MDY8026080.1 hypothetical protein [Paenibacillus polymyxa]
MKRFVYLVLLIVGLPIILNYGLFSWSAPGLNVDENAWLGFFANYVGLISAVCIALYQQYNQRKKDKEDEHTQKLKEDEQDRKSNRSFLVLHDFYANIKLNNVKTHKNSRVIETDGYKWLIDHLKPVVNVDDASTSFIKLSHYGNPEVILDCKVNIEVKSLKGLTKINVDIGVFEKGIEIFIPIVTRDAEFGETVDLMLVKVTYCTLRNEKIEYTHDLSQKKDICKVLHEGYEETLYEFQLDESSWTYPNKLIHEQNSQ